MFTRLGVIGVLSACCVVLPGCSASKSPPVDGGSTGETPSAGDDGDTSAGVPNDTTHGPSSDSLSPSDATASEFCPSDPPQSDAGILATGASSSNATATTSPGSRASDATADNADAGVGETTSDSGSDSTSASLGEHCTPGTPIVVYPYVTVQPCLYDLYSNHELPSATNADVLNVELEAPAIGGEPYAFSFETTGAFSTYGVPLDEWPNFVEIWGTNELCGAAEKLLWWGPEREGILCGEFIPDVTYAHFLFVTRKHVDFTTGTWNRKLMTTCQAGTCPAGADGEGLAPGKTLNPPLVYDAYIPEALGRSYEFRFDGRGYMLLLFDDPERALGNARSLSKGFFHMPAHNRFSDAWYCIGEGSSVTEGDDGVNHLVSLKNITRLPSCETRIGSGTASFTFDEYTLELDSSFSDLQPGALLWESYSSCEETGCEFRFVASMETVYCDRRLYLDLASSVGYQTEPISTPTTVLGAHLFHEPDAASPITVTCSNSGMLTYAPDATSTITLDAMSDYFTCPGEPIEDNSFEFEIANSY